MLKLANYGSHTACITAQTSDLPVSGAANFMSAIKPSSLTYMINSAWKETTYNRYNYFCKNEEGHRDQGWIPLVHASNVAYVQIILYKQHEYR